jgi:hypothetical protein
MLPKRLAGLERKRREMSLTSALWDIYFKPRSWERSGKVYRALGVHKIKELYFYGGYMNTLIGTIRGRRYRPFEGPKWLEHWFAFTFIAEIGHTIIGLVVICYSADCLVRGRVMVSLFTFCINIIFNAYPVMSQRYNRARLMRVLPPTFFSFTKT